MINPDFNYYFYLRKSKSTNPERVPIYLRVSHLGHRKDKSTGLFTAEKHWEPEHFLVKKTDPNARKINKVLEKTKNELNEALIILTRNKEYFSLDDLWAYIEGEREVTFLMPYFEKVIAQNNERIGHSLSPNTQKVYKSTFMHLQGFLKKVIKRSDVPLRTVNVRFIEDFKLYLLKRCNLNTSNKYLKTLKAVLNHGLNDEIIQRNPFDRITLKAGEYDRTFLDETELRAIQNFRPENNRLLLAKEFFIVSAFTGLHYSDIVALDQGSLSENDGKLFIKGKRAKNGESFLVPIFNPVKRILERHRDFSTSNKLFTFYSNSKTNQHLKTIAKLCNISKRLTCKVGRHTFATTVTLQNNVPIESVSKMMGHTKISTTQIYARVLEKKVSKDMEAVMNMYG